jgi:hypothetical protein
MQPLQAIPPSPHDGTTVPMTSLNIPHTAPETAAVQFCLGLATFRTLHPNDLGPNHLLPADLPPPGLHPEACFSACPFVLQENLGLFRSEIQYVLGSATSWKSILL